MSFLLPRLRVAITRHEVLPYRKSVLTRDTNFFAARWRSTAPHKPPSTSSLEESEGSHIAEGTPIWSSIPSWRDKYTGRTERRPPSHVRKQESQRAIAALPKVSVNDFVRLTANGEATADHARSCLYNTKASIPTSLPLSERCDEAASYNIGGRVLHWIWSQSTSVQSELAEDVVFVELAAYFVVAEKREDYIWKWLELTLEPPICASQHNWLGSIAREQWVWSDSVTESLLTWKRALQTFSRRGSYISLSTVLGNICTSETLQPCDPALFDMFMASHMGTTSKLNLAEVRARLLLYHPTSPDARAFLEYVQQNPQWLEGALSARSATCNNLAYHIIRASYILRLLGYEDEARWLESIVRSRILAVWTTRNLIIKRFLADPKLSKLHEAAKEK